jgi:hypothetical protein
MEPIGLNILGNKHGVMHRDTRAANYFKKALVTLNRYITYFRVNVMVEQFYTNCNQNKIPMGKFIARSFISNHHSNIQSPDDNLKCLLPKHTEFAADVFNGLRRAMKFK